MSSEPSGGKERKPNFLVEKRLRQSSDVNAQVLQVATNPTENQSRYSRRKSAASKSVSGIDIANHLTCKRNGEITREQNDAELFSFFHLRDRVFRLSRSHLSHRFHIGCLSFSRKTKPASNRRSNAMDCRRLFFACLYLDFPNVLPDSFSQYANWFLLSSINVFIFQTCLTAFGSCFSCTFR